LHYCYCDRKFFCLVVDALRIVTPQGAIVYLAFFFEAIYPVVYYDICMHQLSTITEDPRWMALEENEQKACLSGYSAQGGKLLQISKFLSVAKYEDDGCRGVTTLVLN
jgi:hypothetical protein